MIEKNRSNQRKTIAVQIEKLRTEILGMTQTQFAVCLGMEEKKGRSKVNNWEQGAIEVKSDDITIISQAFNVSADWLLGLVSDPHPDPNMKMIQQYTGLTSDAIFKLHAIATGIDSTAFPIIISALIEDENAEYFLALLKSIIQSHNTKTGSDVISIPFGDSVCNINTADYLKTLLYTRLTENTPRIAESFSIIEAERSIDNGKHQ